MKTFFESLFSYCPLIWMFCETLNVKINRLHKRGLRIAYSDYISYFEDILVRYIDRFYLSVIYFKTYRFYIHINIDITIYNLKT